mgnify:CR=1 FL=1
MTREEALKESHINDFVCEMEFVQLGADSRGLINKIYNYFESRTCESCKYYDDIYCTNQKVDEMMDEFQQLDNYIRVDKGFGCNKHEAILSYE